MKRRVQSENGSNGTIIKTWILQRESSVLLFLSQGLLEFSRPSAPRKLGWGRVRKHV